MLVTGAAEHLGTRLLATLEEAREHCRLRLESVVAIDVREVPSAKRRAAVDYRVIDVRSGALAHPLTRVLPGSYHPHMGTTKLSSKGQIVLPKSVRQARGWEPGTEFVVEATEDGVHLRVKTPFPRTELDDVFGSVRYKGRPKSLEQMSEAVKRAAGRRYRRAVQR